MNAETARRSVRAGDVVVVEGDEFDLPHPIPVAAVYGEDGGDKFSAVSYGPDGVGALVKVSWDAIEEYHANEKTEHPSIIAHRILEEWDGPEDTVEMALEEIEEKAEETSDHSGREPEDTDEADAVLEAALEGEEP